MTFCILGTAAGMVAAGAAADTAADAATPENILYTILVVKRELV